MIERLERHLGAPEHVCLADGGTGIRKLLFTLCLSAARPRRLLIVDAIDAGREPGEWFEIDPSEIPAVKLDDFSMHQIPDLQPAAGIAGAGRNRSAGPGLPDRAFAPGDRSRAFGAGAARRGGGRRMDRRPLFPSISVSGAGAAGAAVLLGCAAVFRRAVLRRPLAAVTPGVWRRLAGMRAGAVELVPAGRWSGYQPVTIEAMTPNEPAPKLPIAGVKNLIAVGSGKGGVGKTTVAVNLAVGLASLGYRTGLMDADVYGPNVPLMMGINRTPMAYGERIQPLEQFGVRLMSMGFLNPGDKPLVWRGPMLHSVIQQFLRGVDWGELDFLIIDLPPGTGDVQLSLIQTAPITGAIVVTTPSDVSLEDARKAVTHVPPGAGADSGHRGEHELSDLPALPRARSTCSATAAGAARPRRCRCISWRSCRSTRRCAWAETRANRSCCAEARASRSWSWRGARPRAPRKRPCRKGRKSRSASSCQRSACALQPGAFIGTSEPAEIAGQHGIQVQLYRRELIADG